MRFIMHYLMRWGKTFTIRTLKGLVCLVARPTTRSGNDDIPQSPEGLRGKNSRSLHKGGAGKIPPRGRDYYVAFIYYVLIVVVFPRPYCSIFH